MLHLQVQSTDSGHCWMTFLLFVFIDHFSFLYHIIAGLEEDSLAFSCYKHWFLISVSFSTFMTAGTATTVKLRRSLTWWYRHLFVVVKRVVGLEEELSIFVLQILISYFFLTVKFRSSLSSSLLTAIAYCMQQKVLAGREAIFPSINAVVTYWNILDIKWILKTILKISFDVEIVCDIIIYATNCKLHRELEKKCAKILRWKPFFHKAFIS